MAMLVEKGSIRGTVPTHIIVVTSRKKSRRFLRRRQRVNSYHRCYFTNGYECGNRRNRGVKSYHRCYFTHICYLVIAMVNRSTHIIVVTSPAMQCYCTFPFHVLSDSAIPQLSHPYPKKRDYLCHDIVRAMPVRCKTPRVHHALFYK